MSVSYKVTLTPEQVQVLAGIVNRGQCGAQKRKRAQALLFAHQNCSDKENAAACGMHRRGIEELRKRFVESGFELALNGAAKKPRGKKIQGSDTARLIALACETKPDGHSHWSLRILTQKFLTLENVEVDSVSYETIRRELKKLKSSPGKGRNGAFRQKPAQTS